MEIHPVTLTGDLVRLEPLSEMHVPDLTMVGLDEDIWNFMLYGEMRCEDDIRAWVRDMLERQARGADLPFAVIDLKSNRAIGATRFMNIDLTNRGLEIGGTWYGAAYRGVGINTEAKYLLLCHAFEVLGCIRVQFKTDSRNIRSQRAIENLGAIHEGVLRNHMILPSGVIRDSVYYSILDREWSQVKTGLEDQLKFIRRSRS